MKPTPAMSSAHTATPTPTTMRPCAHTKANTVQRTPTGDDVAQRVDRACLVGLAESAAVLSPAGLGAGGRGELGGASMQLDWPPMPSLALACSCEHVCTSTPRTHHMLARGLSPGYPAEMRVCTSGKGCGGQQTFMTQSKLRVLFLKLQAAAAPPQTPSALAASFQPPNPSV